MTDPGNIVGFPDIRRAEEEAADWLVRFEDEDMSAQEQLAFRQWLAANETNAQAYRRIAELWGALDQLSELKDYDASGPAISGGPESHMRRGFLGLAAAFAVAAGAGILAYTSTYQEQIYEERFSTALGEHRTISLPDGSVIELNTASIVAVRMDADKRAIRLEQGEAYFDVAKDSSRPFNVATEAGSVRAVGTAFLVRLEGGSVDVTVEEGRVRLYGPPALTEISAGQRARFGETVQAIEPVPADLIDRKLSWRNGMLAFSGERLDEVVSEMARYTDVTIEIEGDALAAKPVAGYFRTGEIGAMLEALELEGDVKVDRISTRHVRLSARDTE